MTFFAAAALLMATLGTYGVVSYTVRQRTVEIGTRMALGAGSRDLLRLIVGGGLRIAVAGVLLGGAVSGGVVWLMVRHFGIQHLGWPPFAFSAAVIGAVAVVSSSFPAFRATLLSPMVAIRNEPASMWGSARRVLSRLWEGFSRRVAGPGEAPPPPEATLVVDFIEASRRAASFGEAIRAALASLRDNTGAQAALLLENVADGDYRSTASVPDTAAACSLPRRGLLWSRLRTSAAPLPITPADLAVWRRWAAAQKPEYSTEIEAIAGTGARLAVPLRTSREVLGVLLLAAPDGREQYSREERRALRGCAGPFALMLENARLTGRVLEQEMLRRDLALAAEVQRRLLPRQSLETAVLSVSAVNLPARSVGGDYYDFLELERGATGIALADVAGKGVAAALIMSVVQASLRILAAEQNVSLPQLAARMNAFLYRATGASSYATFFYARLEQSGRELRYVNAGHNPPYLLRAGGEAIEELTAGGTIIGMFPCADYGEAVLALRAGDLLFAFTDGVTDALNPAGEEFGEERLKRLLVEVRRLPAEEMGARVAAELKRWIAGAAQYDDLTFVLARLK
jgi:serine phosphatase RsbU (regulator of sigma subunit)